MYVKNNKFEKEDETRLVFLKPNDPNLIQIASEHLCDKYICIEKGKEQWKEYDPSDERCV